MPQMNTSQARVIDPVLTEIARGYRPQEYVGSNLFHIIPVGQRGGKIVKFGAEEFKLYNTARSPGSRVATSDFTFSDTSYSLEQHALTEKVPVELLEEANAVPGIDLGRVAVGKAQRKVGLRLEYLQATLARDATQYQASNKVTLSGTDQWSDYDNSDPLDDIETGRNAIRAKIGMYPNSGVISAAAFAKLKRHPKIVELLKYTSRESLTPEMLAQILELDELFVGKAVYMDQAGAMIDIWGKDMILAYTIDASLADMGSPSYGYTYRLRNYPLVEKPSYSNGDRSWHYTTVDELSPVLAGPDAGYLIKSAVA